MLFWPSVGHKKPLIFKIPLLAEFLVFVYALWMSTYAMFFVTFFLQPNLIMASYTLKINSKTYTVEADPKMPLLWAIRDLAGLTGTKYGCGIAQCGACTVHMGGQPVRSCSIPVSVAAGKDLTTIEGLSADNTHPVQQAWIKEQVPQCGYCQSGQIMAATALLKKTPNPTDKDIDTAMQGHICRCGTYPRIRKAIKTASQIMNQKASAK
jgi:isoquinoline 1-oxidoreductase alpha subunit